jgi:hypothetical protein
MVLRSCVSRGWCKTARAKVFPRKVRLEMSSLSTDNRTFSRSCQRRPVLSLEIRFTLILLFARLLELKVASVSSCSPLESPFSWLGMTPDVLEDFGGRAGVVSSVKGLHRDILLSDPPTHSGTAVTFLRHPLSTELVCCCCLLA